MLSSTFVSMSTNYKQHQIILEVVLIEILSEKFRKSAPGGVDKRETEGRKDFFEKNVLILILRLL